MMTTDGTCPACGADVLWVGGSADQLRAFDVEPVERYVFGPDGPHVVSTFASHFDTCKVRDTDRRLAETRQAVADPPGMIRNRAGHLVRWGTPG